MMIEIIGSSFINWFFLVLLGIGAGFLVQRLDNQREDLIPTLIASIIGAVGGGVLTNLIFGLQITIFNLSSFLISLTGAFLLSIITRILRQQSEEEVQTNLQGKPSSFEYAFFSEVKRPKANSVKDFFAQVKYPISKRDLVRHAEQHGSDWKSLNQLENLPDHIYGSKEEISAHFESIN